MTYTDADLDAFALQNDLEFDPNDGKSSLKTNTFLSERNFESLQLYISKLKAYSVRTAQSTNVDGLVEQILEQFQTSKIIIPITTDHPIGNSVFVEVNGITYTIQRIDSYIIEITSIPDWITDSLIVQVKNTEGIIVYPVITTAENKIKIHFIDGIQTNYNVFFV